MLLIGFSWIDVALGVLYVSLIVIVLVIAYRKLLRYMGKDAVAKKDFCLLHPLEKDPACGELEFYFTTEMARDYKMSILDHQMNEKVLVVENTASIGGNIVRFDSTRLSNGEYFFCLTTENQKTMKKMRVLNA